ncbi:hypothetical protein VNO78_27996 [Psophocarpus tetragonolobus]|uniref:MADS-box domain-containing protein n=1 Tax=Psophocarpus tetragonolobus TaxID=3891 RepID=A0AAN9XB78_PSOTE
MGRTKVNLEFIANDTKRNTTYMKRKKSLLKNTEELSTLCGIEACAIVYGLNDVEPEVWPSESGVQNVVQKFRSIPQWQQSMNMANQKSFVEKSIMKGNEKVRKLAEDNKKKEMSMLMFECFNTGMVQPYSNMNMADLNVLSSVIDQNLEDISKRLEMYHTQTDTSALQLQIQTSAIQPQLQTLTYNPGIQATTLEEMAELWLQV